MCRFVILEHDFPEQHWDFMLEVGGVLKTWRLSQNPVKQSINRKAESIADHRTMYLDYEGEISGNRGTVKRIDRGKYQYQGEQKNPDCWKISLTGQTLHGRLTISKCEDEYWDFEFEKGCD